MQISRLSSGESFVRGKRKKFVFNAYRITPYSRYSTLVTTSRLRPNVRQSTVAEADAVYTPVQRGLVTGLGSIFTTRRSRREADAQPYPTVAARHVRTADRFTRGRGSAESFLDRGLTADHWWTKMCGRRLSVP